MEEFNQGISTPQIYASRIVAHGLIADVSEGFSLTDNAPFSVLIVPVADITAGLIAIATAAGFLLSCKCSQDSESSDLPIMFNEWTKGLISFIDIDAIDLGDYNVYWGVGGKP